MTDDPHIADFGVSLQCPLFFLILSYQKMLGQLQDAGSTVTLAHYHDLLQGAGMVAGRWFKSFQ